MDACVVKQCCLLLKVGWDMWSGISQRWSYLSWSLIITRTQLYSCDHFYKSPTVVAYDCFGGIWNQSSKGHIPTSNLSSSENMIAYVMLYINWSTCWPFFRKERGRGDNWRGALTVFEKDVRTYLKHTHNTSCAITQTISIAYTYIMQYIIRWSNTRTLTLSRKCSRYTARLLN